MIRLTAPTRSTLLFLQKQRALHSQLREEIAPPRPLTDKEAHALAFIQGFVEKHGHGPMWKDVANACGVSSNGSASRLVGCLVAKKKVELGAYGLRSVRVLAPVMEAAE